MKEEAEWGPVLQLKGRVRAVVRTQARVQEVTLWLLFQSQPPIKPMETLGLDLRRTPDPCPVRVQHRRLLVA